MELGKISGEGWCEISVFGGSSGTGKRKKKGGEIGGRVSCDYSGGPELASGVWLIGSRMQALL